MLPISGCATTFLRYAKWRTGGGRANDLVLGVPVAARDDCLGAGWLLGWRDRDRDDLRALFRGGTYWHGLHRHCRRVARVPRLDRPGLPRGATAAAALASPGYLVRRAHRHRALPLRHLRRLGLSAACNRLLCST